MYMEHGTIWGLRRSGAPQLEEEFSGINRRVARQLQILKLDPTPKELLTCTLYLFACHIYDLTLVFCVSSENRRWREARRMGRC